MKARTIRRAWLLAAALLLPAAWSSAQAQEIPVVTGVQWTKSDAATKKAYLVGIANAFQVERAYQGRNAPSDAQSIIPRFERGMRGKSLDTVREGLDRWYAANPGRIDRPVIETIWFEMVVPGLK